ncbi:MAG: hypothetical protein FJ054_00775 [Cyanobacteria bacterium M_surface_10_m2_119]|nr:hypothetical protein [Cyanobacteria bacterium M_surface_10_m2_119]
MACPHCGSWSVIADRSLAGRMVCRRCGRPLGGGGSRVRPLRRRPWPAPGLRGALTGLVLLSALLAWLAEQPARRLAPPPDPGTPALRF